MPAAVLAICLSACLCACGGRPDPNPPPNPAEDPAEISWYYMKNGLHYQIEADKELNRDKDRNLGITLCVYQLTDTVKFRNLASSSSGIDALLDGNPEQAGAVGCRCYNMQPGETVTENEDRLEKAKALGVVAGYVNLKPEMCVAVHDFPVVQDTEGIIFRTKVYSAGVPRVVISLGPNSVAISNGVNSVR